MSEKLDILFFAAHPDDVELACGGTVIKHVHLGKKVGIVDLTKGELGTRGTPEIRTKESEEASKLLGLSARVNLELTDGQFINNPESQLKVISAIRRFCPEIIIANAPSDRHPDHGRGCELVKESCFYSGLLKIETIYKGKNQLPWRPKHVLSYIQDHYHEPDLVFDVSDVWTERMAAVMAYKSQFYDPNSKEPQTPISTEGFQNYLTARALQFGRSINVEYGEGFISQTPLTTNDLTTII